MHRLPPKPIPVPCRAIFGVQRHDTAFPSRLSGRKARFRASAELAVARQRRANAPIARHHLHIGYRPTCGHGERPAGWAGPQRPDTRSRQSVPGQPWQRPCERSDPALAGPAWRWTQARPRAGCRHHHLPPQPTGLMPKFAAPARIRRLCPSLSGLAALPPRHPQQGTAR